MKTRLLWSQILAKSPWSWSRLVSTRLLLTSCVCSGLCTWTVGGGEGCRDPSRSDRHERLRPRRPSHRWGERRRCFRYTSWWRMCISSVCCFSVGCGSLRGEHEVCRWHNELCVISYQIVYTHNDVVAATVLDQPVPHVLVFGVSLLAFGWNRTEQKSLYWYCTIGLCRVQQNRKER